MYRMDSIRRRLWPTFFGNLAYVDKITAFETKLRHKRHLTIGYIIVLPDRPALVNNVSNANRVSLL